MTLEDLAKTLFAFKFGPDDIFGGTSKLFDSSPSGLYTRIFPSPDEPMTHVEFYLLAGTYLGCDFVKSLWEQHRKNLRAKQQTMHPALERKGLIYFAVGELMRESYTRQNLDLEHDLARLSKPNEWLAQSSTTPAQALTKAFEICSKVLSQQYDSKRSNDPNFKHRNWFRHEGTLSDIRKGLDFALEFGFPPKLW